MKWILKSLLWVQFKILHVNYRPHVYGGPIYPVGWKALSMSPCLHASHQKRPQGVSIRKPPHVMAALERPGDEPPRRKRGGYGMQGAKTSAGLSEQISRFLSNCFNMFCILVGPH